MVTLFRVQIYQLQASYRLPIRTRFAERDVRGVCPGAGAARPRSGTAGQRADGDVVCAASRCGAAAACTAYAACGYGTGVGVSAAETAAGGVHGFPAELTSFIGRDGPVHAVADLLGRHRLVTVTGPGGGGPVRRRGVAGGASPGAGPDTGPQGGGDGAGGAGAAWRSYCRGADAGAG